MWLSWGAGVTSGFSTASLSMLKVSRPLGDDVAHDVAPARACKIVLRMSAGSNSGFARHELVHW